MTMHSEVESPSRLYRRGAREAVAGVIAAGRACANLKEIILRERFADARAEAEAKDEAVVRGTRLPLAHLTLAVKACFDAAGWVTDAASAAFAENEPATRLAHFHFLRSQGATGVGHSNMKEFAFGALGVNSTTGTPRTPLDPTGDKVAGGSTSGGAVAVATSLADVALSIDTSGSVRIPATFCGKVEFNPSRGIFSAQGCIPLSMTFDVLGLITQNAGTLLEVTNVFDHLASVVPDAKLLQSRERLAGIRFVIPDYFALGQSDDTVRNSFDRTVARLTGADVVRAHLCDLYAASRAAVEGGVIMAEAYAWHRDWIREKSGLYDTLVGPRILYGETITAHQYIGALARIEALAQLFDAEMKTFDGLLTPTVPILPPRIQSLSDHGEYLRFNALPFSLTELANRVELPSISLPDRALGPQTIGLLLTRRRGTDRDLLEIATHVKAVLV